MTFSITRVQTERGFLYARDKEESGLVLIETYPFTPDDFGLDSKNVVLHNRNNYIYYIIAEYALGQETRLSGIHGPSERDGSSFK